jgi:hypothetical protein
MFFSRSKLANVFGDLVVAIVALPSETSKIIDARAGPGYVFSEPDGSSERAFSEPDGSSERGSPRLGDPRGHGILHFVARLNC